MVAIGGTDMPYRCNWKKFIPDAPLPGVLRVAGIGPGARYVLSYAISS